mmetsp:Transcript_43149/g.142820  ORF Transcript_43149/g.142820 Transcript_43149/m.142820 type:complete len:392 (+) Transcript_43149:127-1302(+)
MANRGLPFLLVLQSVHSAAATAAAPGHKRLGTVLNHGPAAAPPSSSPPFASANAASAAESAPAASNAVTATAPEAPIFAYAAFDKVGATTFRTILSARERLHNRSYLCDPWFARHRGGCRDVPGEAVVNVGADRGFDFCERQGRPCRYFTLLRHPLERIRSAHAYFCVACSEHHRQCGGHDVHQWGGRLSCPNMSLAAYARTVGSVYTRAFAPKEPSERAEEKLETVHAEIASLTRLDAATVREIVRTSCHNRRDEAYRALDQFQEGTGPFVQATALTNARSKERLRRIDAAERYLKSICTLVLEPAEPPRPTIVQQLARWMGDPLFESKISLVQRGRASHAERQAREAPQSVSDALMEDIELYRRMKHWADRGEACTEGRGGGARRVPGP